MNTHMGSSASKILSVWYASFLLILLVLIQNCIAAFGSPVSSSYIFDTSDKIVVGNKYIEIIFDKNDKGGLVNIVNKLTGVAFLSEKRGAARGEPHLLFYIGTSGTHTFMAREFAYSFNAREDGKTLLMRWRGFVGGDKVARNRFLDIEIEVNVTVLDDSPLTYWAINAVSHEEDVDLSDIAFPIVSGLTKIGENSEDDYLAYPALTGLLLRNPLEKMPVNPEIPWQLYPSGWVSMQFLAFYDVKLGGLYVASDDTEGNVKKFSVYRFSMKDWNIAVTHLSPYGTMNFTPSYRVVMGVFVGDWYTAADMYKEWAEKQWWCVEARKRSTPSWFLEVSAIHSTSLYTPNDSGWASRIPFATVPQLAQDSIRTLGMPVIMQVWGWEKHGTFKLIPDYFPPIEGWEAFDRMVEGVHKAGGKVSVFIATNSFSTKLPEWEQMKKYSVKLPYDQSGEYRTMCPGAREWREYVKTIVLTLVKHGVDHVHLDGSLIDPPYPCLDEGHGHPKGYGKWWFESYRNLFSEVIIEAKKFNPEIVFSSEEVCELYIPYLDRFYSRGNAYELYPTHWYWQISGAQAIPMFQYVYREYISSWGHYVHGWSLSETAYSIKALAASLVWGEPLEIRLPTLNERMSLQISFNPIVQFFKKAAVFRYTWGREFLVYGSMVKPLSISSPTIVIANPHWHLSPYELNATVTPAVLHSAWRSRGGDVAFIFANILDENVSLHLYVNLSEYGFSGNANAILIQDDRPVHIGSHLESFSLDLSLGPREIAMIEVSEKMVVRIDSNPRVVNRVFAGDRELKVLPSIMLFSQGAAQSFEAPSVVNIDNKTRFAFTYWIVEKPGATFIANSSLIQIVIDSNLNLSATYMKQCFVSGVSRVGQVHGEGWYNEGAIAKLWIDASRVEHERSRALFEGWYEGNLLLSSNSSISFVVDRPRSFEARWRVQHYVAVSTPYSAAEGEGWYDEGSRAVVKLRETEVYAAPLIHQVFDYWEGLEPGDRVVEPGVVEVSVDKPRELKAVWRADYSQLAVLLVACAIAAGSSLAYLRRKRKAQRS